MMFECNICHQSFPSLMSLHSHLTKKEKVERSDYYHMFYPRLDLLTGALLEFKDREQYFNSFFNCKENLIEWFKQNYKTDKAKQIALEILKHRKESKNLKFLPSQIELRTINSPSIIGLERVFGSYDVLRGTLGLAGRFDYNPKILPVKNLKIVIDTREQEPFNFPGSKVQKIDVGDYTAADPDYSDVHIERKSQSDFFGTFYNQNNFERFKKELDRAKEFGIYLVVIVENSLESCLNFKSFFVKDKNLTSHTFHNVRDIMQKYDNCQFLFCWNKGVAQNMVSLVLSQGEAAKRMDWQFLMDKRLI